MSDELKNCPHCGNSDHLKVTRVEGETVSPDNFQVVCSWLSGGCGASGGVRRTESEAIAAWNTRADDAPEQPVDNQADSRERLEADMWEFIERWAFDDDDERRPTTHLLCSKELHGLLDRQAAITRRETLLENPLHNNPYVGMVRGKQWERKESSDYYCGKCGWKVTDHDSYCTECGGALHRAPNRPTSQFDAPKSGETAEYDVSKSEMRDFDDSREKLEADVTATVSNLVKYCDAHPALFEKAKSWLDRQAAITERECMTAAGLAATEAPALQAKVDSLTAERDGLRKQLAEKQRVIDMQRDSFAKMERECAELRQMLSDAAESI